MRNEFQENEFVKLAQIAIKFKLEKFYKFKTLIQTTLPNKIPPTKLNNLPFSYMHNNQVVVYPNFNIFNNSYILPKMDCSRELRGLLKNIQKDLLDDKLQQRWSSLNRGRKYLLKRETMSLGRLLTRYLSLKEYIPDHEIRDFVTEVSAKFLPMKLIWCETPLDYFNMFKAKTNTCMVNYEIGSTVRNHHGPATGKFWEELKQINMFPSIWYYYNPSTRGIYAERGGIPVARAFILDEKGYGSIHATDAINNTEFREELEKIGFKHTNSIHVTKQFNIPGINSSKGIVCPLPHCDDINKPFYCSYNKGTQEFTFSNKALNNNSLIIRDTYSHEGYINANLFN